VTRSWIGSDLGTQSALAVNARDLLPAGHPAFAFQTLVGRLDLSAFAAAYRADGRGRPPFHPRMMVTLLVYCRSKGIVSARAVAAACHDDLGARMITGNRFPKRSTLDQFRKTHARALKGLLAQTIRMGATTGLLDLSVVAGDGTYLLANAAMAATVDEAALLAQITDLQRQVAAAQATWLEQAGTPDTSQHTLFTDTLGTDTPGTDTPGTDTPGTDTPGTDTPGTGTRADAAAVRRSATGDARHSRAWRRLDTLNRMLHSRQAALTHLRAHPNSAVTDWSQRLDKDQQRVEHHLLKVAHARAEAQAKIDRHHAEQAAGIKIQGKKKPVPVEQHIRVRQALTALQTATARAAATALQRPSTTRVNTTDPASAIMPGKHDGYDQRHNVQALACKNQFILAITTHHSSNDKQALTNLLRTGRANLDTAGITDPIGTALFDNGYASEANFTADLPVELLLVAVEKEARQTLRLQDGTSTAAHAWQAMATRLDHPDNRTLYQRRGAIIEPLFAQLFARFGRATTARGDDVDTELHLWAVTHNLLKISHHRPKTRPPT
jgi:transposase